MAKYDELRYKSENAFTKSDSNEDIFSFCEGYKDFLTYAKTERRAVALALDIAEQAGFKNLNSKKSLKPGDKVYDVYNGKDVVLAVIGKEKLEDGLSIIASHIDAPRLDLKPTPLYESMEMALMKTHYYGGIKKYQWASIPLSMFATVVLSDGSKCEFVIGEDKNDPVFTVTDLLPHLAAKQSEAKLRDGISGEQLNVLVGGLPLTDEDEELKSAIKLNALKILNDKYGMVEEDFISAEIEIVPNFPARDIGFDRAFVGGYGQDDRICAYTSLLALLNIKQPERTAVCLLVDKEEIGSCGISGIQSTFIENCMIKMLALTGNGDSYARLQKTFENSVCLSADVSAAVDPTFPEVHDKFNAPFASRGVVLTKYTGARGKSGASDASAELMGYIRKIFNDAGVIWQTGELGKVDEGGGGTVSQFVAQRNIPTVDCGPALLGMHSPFEVASKADVFMSFKAYQAFYEKN